ncbi:MULTISPECIES: ribonuclease inhibitor [unclassified Sphingomonas]|uniref:ribonuclease inhibitor n=1 Tax=unclassified Sphingomonas TaxID=196159 RepID=UPI00226A245C|nr:MULTISPECIES: ribonuclease inhibitor [unclassified Sphingomonas]
MLKKLQIVGSNIVDIPTFYAEINRVFMADEGWALAESLDALNDLLYGSYGSITGSEPVELVWHDMETSRSALGIETTRSFLMEKLQGPTLFNAQLIGGQLNALDRGTGNTYFETILEIIGDHHNITLVAA